MEERRKRVEDLLALVGVDVSQRTVTHEAVETADKQAEALGGGDLPGLCKNLFLKPKKGSMVHVTAPWWRKLDLKSLAAKTSARGGLRFGPADALQRLLGVTAGSCTPLSAAFDEKSEVRIVLDQWMMDDSHVEWLYVHPMSNEATVKLRPSELRAYLDKTGHANVEIVDLGGGPVVETPSGAAANGKEEAAAGGASGDGASGHGDDPMSMLVALEEERAAAAPAGDPAAAYAPVRAFRMPDPSSERTAPAAAANMSESEDPLRTLVRMEEQRVAAAQ